MPITSPLSLKSQLAHACLRFWLQDSEFVVLDSKLSHSEVRIHGFELEGQSFGLERTVQDSGSGLQGFRASGLQGLRG